MKLCGAPRIKYIGKPTHNLFTPYLLRVFVKQSKIPLYYASFLTCFWSFTLILSAGNDKNDVKNDATIADKLSYNILLFYGSNLCN